MNAIEVWTRFKMDLIEAGKCNSIVVKCDKINQHQQRWWRIVWTKNSMQIM